jgi:hypothetical protein
MRTIVARVGYTRLSSAKASPILYGYYPKRRFSTGHQLFLNGWSMAMALGSYPTAMFPLNKEIDPWISDMQGIDLPSRRQVLKRMTPPMSQFLYKYMAFDQAHSYENLRDVIVGSVLRLNSPSRFNDPFEMAAHIVMTATTDEKLARFESLAREQAPHLGWRAIQAHVQALIAAIEDSFTPIWQRSLTGIRESAGMYCFAGSGKKRLMWGHYALNHRGICLQFERTRDLATLGRALPGDYVLHLPVLNWVKGFYEDIGRMLLSKDPCWEYEQESRILIHGQASRYLRFQPEALRKVIFGCRAEHDFVKAVEDCSMSARRRAIRRSTDTLLSNTPPSTVWS